MKRRGAKKKGPVSAFDVEHSKAKLLTLYIPQLQGRLPIMQLMFLLMFFFAICEFVLYQELDSEVPNQASGMQRVMFKIKGERLVHLGSSILCNLTRWGSNSS